MRATGQSRAKMLQDSAETKMFRPSPFGESERERRRRKKRRKRRGKPAKRWPLVLLSFVALLLLVTTLLATLPGFRLQKIVVSGNYRVDNETLRQYVEYHLGCHMVHGMGGSVGAWLKLDYGNDSAAIKRDYPQFKSVRVSFSYPSTLKVVIEERVAVVNLRVAGGYALVDSDGVVMDISIENSSILPVFAGIETSLPPVTGEKISLNKENQLAQAIKFTADLIRYDQQHAEKLMSLISQIDMQEGYKYVIYLPLPEAGSLRVKLKDDRYLEARLSLLTELLFEQKIGNNGSGELDLTGKTARFTPDHKGE